MANYSLIIDSRFRPFEYSELMAPLLQATQAHQVLEDAYGEIEKEASALDRKTEGSEKLNRIYKKYISDLQNASDVLSKSGLSLDSRRSVLNLRSRYAKELVPIIESIQKRNDVEKMQQEILLKDPTHLFDRMASDVSLDEFYDNPQLDLLSQNYSGELIRTQSAQAFANTQKTLTEEGKLEKVLPFQYKQKLTMGIPLEAVLAELAADPNAPRDKRTKAEQLINETVDNVLKSTGILNWSSINGDITHPTYQKARRWALQGAFSGIGTTTYATYTDQYNANVALEKVKLANTIAAQNNSARNQIMVDNNKAANDLKVARASRPAGSSSSGGGGGTSLNTDKRFTTRAVGSKIVDKNTDDLNWAIQKGYIVVKSNGDLDITPAGKKAGKATKYNIEENGEVYSARLGNRFTSFLERNGLGHFVNGNAGNGPDSRAKLRKIYNSSQAKGDLSVAGEYTRLIHPTANDNITALLTTSAKNSKVPTINITTDGKGRVKKTKGSGFNINKELLGSGQGIASGMLVSSPAGNYLEVVLKNGHRYLVDIADLSDEVNSVMSKGRDQGNRYLKMKQDGISSVGINGIPVSTSDAFTITTNESLDNGMTLLNLSNPKSQDIGFGEYGSVPTAIK